MPHGNSGWSALSDKRLKTGIEELPNEYGLRAILQLKPVVYHWKDKENDARQLGFIAQDVKPVLPELVTKGPSTKLTPDGSFGVNYTNLVVPLVKAVQELKAANDNLRTEHEAEIKAIRADFEAFKNGRR